MFNIYDNIKELAEKHGYSVSGMCDAMGMSRATLSNLKNGRAETLSVRNFKRIAEFLEEPLDIVMHGAPTTAQRVWLDVAKSVLEENDKKESPSDLDELEDYIQMLRDRPECRALLKTASGATRTEVEENVRFIEALRTAKKTD